MVLNDATGRCADHGMMTRDVAGNGAHGGSLHAALRIA
jgi:hypothetical protein